MPNPMQALLALGELIAFLDDKGVVQFAWLGDPLNKSLDAMPGQRALLHPLLQNLIRDNAPVEEHAFPLSGMAWEPVNLGENIGVGFAWNTEAGDPLRIGLGAVSSVSPGGKLVDLAVLARLIRINNGKLTTEVPGFVFGGSIPVPDFLHSAVLSGEVPDPMEVKLTVDADATNERSRSLTLSSDHLAWDVARLAVFILQSWVRAQTGDPFDRLNRHLFPMMGDTSDVIEPFPLFGAENMGKEPNFDPWVSSVISLDDEAAGALTFLWHLRALLTDNEDPTFLGGSIFMPLVQSSTGEGRKPERDKDAAGLLTEDHTGTFVGVEEEDQGEGNLRLVIRLQNGSSRFTIPLAENSSGSLVRPDLKDDPAALGSFDLPGTWVVDGSGPTKLTVIDWLLPPNAPLPPGAGIGGTLKIDLLLTKDDPVGYQVTLPTPSAIVLTFPPSGGGPFPTMASSKQAFSGILELITAAAKDNEASALVTALQAVISAALLDQEPDPQPVLAAILAAVGEQDVLAIGDLFTIDLEDGAVVRADLTFDEVSDAFANSPIGIGKAGVDAKLALLQSGSPLESMTFRLEDIRIDPGAAGAGGIAGGLLGDLRDAPGFFLKVEWTPPDKVLPSGGGRIPIQQTIGPLELSTLLVEVESNGSQSSVEVALDASFRMGPVSVTPYELGVRIPFSGSKPTMFLRGLGLGMDAGAIKLGGHFAEIDGDYVGAALVSVVDFFELSAIGGYTQLPDGSDSLFVFASLVAPLGGPPYLFITGVAGGFGYNRLLPPPGPIAENPFLRVMRGEIEFGGGTASSLKSLGKQFLPQKGQHWIAAGVQFVSFGFIHGKLVVVIGFPRFSLQILGAAAFSIAPVAHFEIELQATADEEKFTLTAGLSHNSYVIHPDIFSLHGQFGLATWHGGEHAGDFVFSVGGYHGAFPVPQHYPTLDRVGVTASVYGFVRLSVECFFATTPRAMMAGAALSLSAKFEGIAAGLDVYIDVYIEWDPFFMSGRMGVVVWFEFMGRHEISVHLEIHTPPLGGTATIDLELVSFDIEFGDRLLAASDDLSIPDFIEGQLGVPADPWGPQGARVAGLSTAERAGLFRLDMLSGRTSQEKHESDAQEGITTSDPIRVGSEFAFAVRTRLPVAPLPIQHQPMNDPAVTGVYIDSLVDLPLCGDDDLVSRLTVTGRKVNEADLRPLDDAFPAAQFGVEVEGVHADSNAKAQIGSEKHEEALIDLTQGIEFTYAAKFDPPEATDWDLVATEESSEGKELYPLPLGVPARPVMARAPRTKLQLAQVGGRAFKAPGRRPAKLTRQALVRQRIDARVAKPLELAVRSAPVQRQPRLAHPAGPGFAVRPAGVPVTAPPPSPLRRPELLELALCRVEPRTPATIGMTRPTTGDDSADGRTFASRTATHVAVARSVVTRHPRPELRRVGDRSQTSIPLQPGRAALLEMIADRPPRGAITVRGPRPVRAIFLGAKGQPVADLHLPATHSGPLPPRARQVVLFTQGDDAPVAAAGRSRGRATEAVGVDQDSTLTALSSRAFAAHGCVLESLSFYAEPVEALDAVAAFDLLRAVPILRVHFPAVPANGTLVLVCEPVGGEAGSATDQIRWRSVNAELASPRIVTRTDRVALAMMVAAEEPWVLDVDLGPGWRLCAAVWRPQHQRSVVDWLAATPDWA
jgi:hypothetical protein